MSAVLAQPPVTAAEFPALAERIPHEASPISGLVRTMRGRWLFVGLLSVLLAPALAFGGYMSGKQLFESQAILRLYPQESNILYRSGDDSILKTFDSFAKAETTYVASNPVMEHATARLQAEFPELAAEMNPNDLAGSIEIKRNDSLIVLVTRSADPAFAAAKLDAVLDAYFDLKQSAEDQLFVTRLEELQDREAELLARQQEIRDQMIDVGGEYGLDALRRAHVEKVAQIDALQSRLEEVSATLISLQSDDGSQSADMADQEIMRATLLDRALADLNFDRAKREAELATILTRYPENSPQVRDKLAEIAIIDQSMADRRQQITVLGQTGALTDTSTATSEDSINELIALQTKVQGQVDEARSQARDLNAKQIELSGLVEEAEAMRDLLDETRNALEVIRLEAGQAIPGFAEVMSPASLPMDPAEDSTKMLAAAGLAGGLVLSLVMAFGIGIMSRKVRYSDALMKWTHLVPIAHVAGKKEAISVTADRLRNAVQLHPLRISHQAGKPRTLALVRLDNGAPDELAYALAASFGRARMKTLLIDADLASGALTKRLGFSAAAGWREALAGHAPDALPILAAPGLSVLPCGHLTDLHDASVSIGACRDALARIGEGFDVVILNAGSKSDMLSSELAVSASDLAIAEVRSTDQRKSVTTRLARLDQLPRQGGLVAFTKGRRDDPGLIHR
jgi:succinoglycan biosynthesis transport protein ExoP